MPKIKLVNTCKFHENQGLYLYYFMHNLQREVNIEIVKENPHNYFELWVHNIGTYTSFNYSILYMFLLVSSD